MFAVAKQELKELIGLVDAAAELDAILSVDRTIEPTEVALAERRRTEKHKVELETKY